MEFIGHITDRTTGMNVAIVAEFDHTISRNYAIDPVSLSAETPESFEINWNARAFNSSFDRVFVSGSDQVIDIGNPITNYFWWSAHGGRAYFSANNQYANVIT